MKSFKSPFANMVPVTNVKSDLIDLRRLTKVLDMIADKADNKGRNSDESVLIISMYPQVPHITFGMVRAAMEEVELVEDAHKVAALALGKPIVMKRGSQQR